MRSPAGQSVILHMPGQGEGGFSRPDPRNPEFVHTRAGLEIAIEGILFETARQKRKGAVLLGEVGSGKSAFLDRVLEGQHLPPDLVPTKVHVPDDGDTSILDSLVGDRGSVLYVLDDLDRILDPERRESFMDAVRRAADRIEAARWLVSTRFRAYETAQLGPAFVEFHIRPMSDEGSVGLARILMSEPGIAGEFLEALRSRPAAQRENAFTAGYPGQLQLLCRAWMSRHAIPSSRNELVEAARSVGADARTIDGLLEWDQLGDARTAEVSGGPSDPLSDSQFVRIPDGRFTMGSKDDDEGRWTDEGPRHEVSIGAFECSVTPVTNAQYARFLESTPGARVPAYWGDARFNRDQQPVVGLWREDARAFAEWAGARLLSESEWEYACRAGVDEPRYGALDEIAWWMGNSGGKLHAVGTRTPNAFGLHDMIGNVWEYVEDDRHDSYDGAPTDGSAWVDEPRGSVSLLRGGSWADAPRVVRCTTRLTHHPGPRVGNVGFRIARSID